MSYVAEFNPGSERQSAAAAQDEVGEFLVSRLAELVVVLFNDHVGSDTAALRDKAEGRAVMLALGDVAADHGRPELASRLHRLAGKIDPAARTRPSGGRLLATRRATGTISFRW